MVLSGLTYILPIRARGPVSEELINYLQSLPAAAEVIVVDASSPSVFDEFHRRCPAHVRHVEVDRDFQRLVNGKVAGVLTGVRRASHERIVIADDDVRYSGEALQQVVEALDHAAVVRPQNYFDPLPWHARIDTARTLLNRVTGGDWPGTLGVRRSALRRTGGYAGDVLFENLELVRTVKAAGGVEACRPDIYVRRLPPSARQFWSQRVRQAYDEWGRPVRLAVWLSLLPCAAALVASSGWRGLLLPASAAIGLAEAGRRRCGGRGFFPASASLLAPVWLFERAVCAWIAAVAAVAPGGVPYHGRIVRRAATPRGALRRRLAFADSRLRTSTR